MELLFGESGLNAYLLPALVTLLLLVQYLAFTMLCGVARVKSGVEAPACSGDESFERAYRVHQNTLEQLMLTLPSIWLCALFFSTNVAAIGGAVFLLARFIYRAGYIADPGKRAPGMIIGMLANVVMLFSALWGVVSAML